MENSGLIYFPRRLRRRRQEQFRLPCTCTSWGTMGTSKSIVALLYCTYSVGSVLARAPPHRPPISPAPIPEGASPPAPSNRNDKHDYSSSRLSRVINEKQATGPNTAANATASALDAEDGDGSMTDDGSTEFCTYWSEEDPDDIRGAGGLGDECDVEHSPIPPPIYQGDLEYEAKLGPTSEWGDSAARNSRHDDLKQLLQVHLLSL